MNIALSNGKALRGDMVVSAVLRSDLTPIPQTLEATVRLDDELKPFVREGSVIEAGTQGTAFRIVKTVDNAEAQGVQGDRLAGSVSLVGLMDACHPVAYRRQTAVIKEGHTIGGIYRACGARVAVESDFPLPRFACLVGDVPSFWISKVLQEEGGTLVWAGTDRLRFVRLPDLFQQRPVDRIGTDTTEDITSGFLERHEVPSFFSINAEGAFVFGNRNKVRAVQYQPRADARVLRNMTRVLVQKKIMRTQFAGHIKAGDVVRVGETPYVVVTAAHVHESGTDGGGPDSYTKLWLGTLEE